LAVNRERNRRRNNGWANGACLANTTAQAAPSMVKNHRQRPRRQQAHNDGGDPNASGEHPSGMATVGNEPGQRRVVNPYDNAAKARNMASAERERDALAVADGGEAVQREATRAANAKGEGNESRQHRQRAKGDQTPLAIETNATGTANDALRSAYKKSGQSQCQDAPILTPRSKLTLPGRMGY